MLLAAKLICVATLLVEVSLFGILENLPPILSEAHMFLASVVWLVSPLLALFLAASSKGSAKPRDVLLLIAAVACAVAVSTGLGPMIPALQWAIVIVVFFFVATRAKRGASAVRT